MFPFPHPEQVVPKVTGRIPVTLFAA